MIGQIVRKIDSRLVSTSVIAILPFIRHELMTNSRLRILIGMILARRQEFPGLWHNICYGKTDASIVPALLLHKK
jgi:hypothetical protein